MKQREEFKRANDELLKLKEEEKKKEQEEELLIQGYAHKKDRMEGIKKAKAEQKFKEKLETR